MIVGFVQGEWRQDRAGSDLWHFSLRSSEHAFAQAGAVCHFEAARLGNARNETPYSARICAECWRNVYYLARGERVPALIPGR